MADTGVGLFVDTVLTGTLVKIILVMCSVLVVNGMRRSLILFVNEPDYNIMMMSTFLGFTVL